MIHIRRQKLSLTAVWCTKSRQKITCTGNFDWL